MKNQIKTLEIKNFKTIKNSKKINCKRINIFIGKPNVGKSNILEAISLLGGTYSIHTKFLSDFIRYENFENLFYDNELSKNIEVISNIGCVNIQARLNPNVFDYIIALDEDFVKKILKEGTSQAMVNSVSSAITQGIDSINSIRPYYACIKGSDNAIDFETEMMNSHLSPVKKYDFDKKVMSFTENFYHYLKPPSGRNLFAVVQKNKKIYKELTSLFKDYKLELVLRIKEKQFEIQKKINGVVYSYPYSTIADTLQRFIFYTMAIETNKDSVILLEEPEAHSFPPYIRKISEKIIESNENQFFITTHSPFILNTIIENCPLEDVAVFVADYKNHQTTIKPLSEKDIKNMLDYGSDIFFNLK